MLKPGQRNKKLCLKTSYSRQIDLKIKMETRHLQVEVISWVPTSYGFARLNPRPDVGRASQIGILLEEHLDN